VAGSITPPEFAVLTQRCQGDITPLWFGLSKTTTCSGHHGESEKVGQF